MNHFPIFLATENERIVLSGGADAAEAKLRLLLKTRAQIDVFAASPSDQLERWAQGGRINLHKRKLGVGDLNGAALCYAADEDEARDAETAELARAQDVLVNIVDNLHGSDFITPAIVDRDPVTVAIGTEGAAPVLARAIKADLEETLPPLLGLMAKVGKAFRTAADILPIGRARRDFWRDYYFRTGPKAVQGGEGSLRAELEKTLQTHMNKSRRAGHVAFVGAGPGDPELLTLKARKVLDEADVVIHDRLIPQPILELARREATIIDVGKEGFGPSTKQSDINDLILEHASRGAQVVRLKGGDATMFGRLDEELDALADAEISWEIIPGITAASAAVAEIGQSLTKRGRNKSVRFLTGHDMNGFAEHDWADLANQGEVAAIYMGKKSARFIQGRLLMHGASPQTPVTIVENASRASQRIIETTLAALEPTLTTSDVTGPALTLLGLAPRSAQAANLLQTNIPEAL